MPEQKYMPHISENCFGKCSDQQPIEYGLGVALGNRSDDVKQYKNSKHKCKKDLKYLKNQNKMLYIIAKKSESRRELKNIKRSRSSLPRSAATLL